MKVLHYIRDFSHPSETFVRDLLFRQSKNIELDSKVLVTNLYNEYYRSLPNLTRITPFSPWYMRLFYFLKSEPYQSRVKKFVLDYNPDIIHCHFGPNGVQFYNLCSKIASRFHFLISMHGSDSTAYLLNKPDYKPELLSISKNKNVHFCVNSDYIRNELEKLGIKKKKIFVCYNCVNNSFLEKKSFHKVHLNEPIRVISVGRLVNIKGFKYLIEGFALFLKKHTCAASLTLVGNGPLHSELQKIVRNNNLERHITFLGAVEHKELADILHQHDIYIQPSIKDTKNNQSEAFGVSVLEAIMCGLIVVVTNTGGLKEAIIKPTKFSYVIQDRSPEAICSILNHLISNKIYTLDNKSYKLEVIEKYSEAAYDKRLLATYKKIISNA